jgi:hypothetical protein
LVACNSPEETPENVINANPEEGSSLAMVDDVSVVQRQDHYYAVINGFYPDPCTQISSVEQVVDEGTISITLRTERPPDLLCATMLTPFVVDILLTTGSLLPQEYSVVVNDGPSTTFSLE